MYYGIVKINVFPKLKHLSNLNAKSRENNIPTHVKTIYVLFFMKPVLESKSYVLFQ
jgi:hypothetical protein